MDRNNDFPTTDKSDRSLGNDPSIEPLPSNKSNDFNILYLTFGLIIIVIIIWLIIVSTNNNVPPKILLAMNNKELQIPPVSDKIK
jgi:hypothetical protein